MQRTYKYRLYPNKEQVRKLEQTLNICRNLYNDALTQRREYYSQNGKGLSRVKQQELLKERKREDTYLQEVHSQVLQDVLFRVEKAFALFFVRLKAKGGRAGYPRYKSYSRYHSFTYPQQPGFRLTNKGLRLSKIGTIKIKLHRPIQGEIKTCTIKREIDRWFACFSCQVNFPSKTSPQRAVGIDVGVTHFAYLSSGEAVSNPKYLIASEKKLKKAQRRLSKRKIGSKNRNKQKVKVAKLHRKIKDQRNDFLHKLSRRIVNNFSFIAVENLIISNMLKNHHLAKSIADASWGRFLDYLTYKVAETGGKIVKVNPQGTSQICSSCGNKVSKSLSVRVHRCPYCGISLPRDYNSALNILQRAVGREPPEFTPLETANRQSLN